MSQLFDMSDDIRTSMTWRHGIRAEYYQLMMVYDVIELSPRWIVNSQYLQKAHLHIVVLSIPHHQAMFRWSNAGNIIALSLPSISSLGLTSIININSCETKTFNFENIMARNKTFNFDPSVQLDEKSDSEMRERYW